MGSDRFWKWFAIGVAVTFALVTCLTVVAAFTGETSVVAAIFRISLWALTCYWFGVGAWRRTTYSWARRPEPPDT